MCCVSLYKFVAVLCSHDGIVVVAVVCSFVWVCVYVCICVCVLLFVYVCGCACVYLHVLESAYIYQYLHFVCIFCVRYIVFICCIPRTTSPTFHSLHFAPEQVH